MFLYACDWCGRAKGPRERWILGYSAERRGPVSVRREFRVCRQWVHTQHPLAVHFCCEEHKERYRDALFGGASEILVASGAATRPKVRPTSRTARFSKSDRRWARSVGIRL